jgi:TfoX/Sxy family transcriptional regulator of competence genes
MPKRPVIPKSDAKIAALFETLLPADERVVIRPMFGHRAAFVNGHMFTGTFGSQVFVRLDEQSRTDLLAIAGAAPFEPMKGRPMREYVQLPKALLTEPHEARIWVERSLAWISTLPPKGPTKGAKSSARRPRPAGRTRAREDT